MTTVPKFSTFQNFYEIFVKFLTDFVDWNVKDQQGKGLLSSGLFRKVYCVFQTKMSQIDNENDKNTKTFQFSKILCTFC